MIRLVTNGVAAVLNVAGLGLLLAGILLRRSDLLVIVTCLNGAMLVAAMAAMGVRRLKGIES